MHPGMPPKPEALADVLLSHPFICLPVVDPLVAYGYVRTPDDDPATRRVCAAVLDLWCATKGRMIGAWFPDSPETADEALQPGLTGFIDVLPVYSRTVALITESASLSPQVGAALVLQAVIRRIGAGPRVLDEGRAEALA